MRIHITFDLMPALSWMATAITVFHCHNRLMDHRGVELAVLIDIPLQVFSLWVLQTRYLKFD